MTRTSGPRRVEPVAAQQLSYSSRDRRRWKTSVCGQPVTTMRSAVDAVVAHEVVAHDVVLHDVAVEVRRDARPCRRCDPSSRRSRRPAGRADARRRGTARRRASAGWRATSAPQSPRIRARAARAGRTGAAQKCQRIIARSSGRASGAVGRRGDGVEDPVRVPRAHPLGVEAVPQVEPDRERVEAEPPRRASASAGARAFSGRRRRATAAAPRATTCTRHLVRQPLAAALRSPSEHETTQPVAEPRRAARRRCRTRRRPASRAARAGRARPAVVTARSRGEPPPMRSRERGTVEPVVSAAPPRGVPQAGQPSTPKTVTGRARRAARRRAACRRAPPTGAWSSTTKTCVVAADDASASHVRVDAVEPRHVDDLERDAVGAQRLGGGQRLVQHHRPVGEEQRVLALAEHVPAPGREPSSGREARSGAATARSRAGSRRSPSASSTAQRSSARVSSAFAGLDDGHARAARRAARRRGRSGATCPGPPG